jgi:hypothetical protein
MNALKDDRLAGLAEHHNVAQFLSFTPGTPVLRHNVTNGVPGSAGAADVAALLRGLLSDVGSVNVRTFRDGESKSTPFCYGLRDVDEAESKVRDFARDGYYTIVNETVDVKDGGVSGVTVGGVTEFAPGSTPRAVEEEGDFVARLPNAAARAILRTVYGFEPGVEAKPGERIEFSLHPLRVGQRKTHTLVWEVQSVPDVDLSVVPSWPNEFSRHIGDKVYGLLVAHAFGLRVPRATVIGRNVAPFTFGTSTGTAEFWIRTSPATADPGHFTTAKGWLDPFRLLAKEDDDGGLIASVLSQESVPAVFSGGAMGGPGGEYHVEGVRGHGDEFMLGAEAQELPADLIQEVHAVLDEACAAFGSVQIEWVYDGAEVWVVQLHARPNAVSSPGVLSPGDADRWLPYDPSTGLDRLRELVQIAKRESAGVEVTKAVGVTSHVGDVLRQARVPARLAAGV